MSMFPFIKRLKSGSYGTVFQSRMPHDGKMIDVVVNKFRIDGDIFTTNARYEFEMLSSIDSHQNILSLLDFQSDKDFLYLITECGSGEYLEQFLKERIPFSGN